VPELPEVETLRRELAQKLKGKTIARVKVWAPKTVRPLTARVFGNRLHGKKITTVERRAKLLIIKLEDETYVLIHLKMTGQLIFEPIKGKLVIGGHPQPGGEIDLPNKFTRLALYFTDGSALYFNDMRRFGWVRSRQSLDEEPFLKKVGLEPLTDRFTEKKLTEFLGRYPKRKIKPLLLDQSLIAGLGNIYVDEALFEARIRPERISGEITKIENGKLHKAIKRILKLSVQKGGTSFRDYKRSDGRAGGFVPHLKVYGRAGEPCKKCRRAIEKTTVVGRGTHFCSDCQK